eukprot:334513-Prymnesium_polylepis.1
MESRPLPTKTPEKRPDGSGLTSGLVSDTHNFDEPPGAIRGVVRDFGRHPLAAGARVIVPPSLRRFRRGRGWK